uniref:Uncharacterized protein n=1 Tax=viral metagenome TaxID=1070528 RepID=A0A6M3JQF7_9ZZZZ
MKRLITIIGPAPSEITLEDFEEKLAFRRRDVARDLEVFRGKAKPPKGKKPMVSDEDKEIRKELAKALKELGMTPEEFLEAKRELDMEAKGEKE